jgi:hypothetical protein
MFETIPTLDEQKLQTIELLGFSMILARDEVVIVSLP